MRLHGIGTLRIVLGLETHYSSGQRHTSFSALLWSKEDAALIPTGFSFFCSILMGYLGEWSQDSLVYLGMQRFVLEVNMINHPLQTERTPYCEKQSVKKREPSSLIS